MNEAIKNRESLETSILNAAESGRRTALPSSRKVG